MWKVVIKELLKRKRGIFLKRTKKESRTNKLKRRGGSRGGPTFEGVGARAPVYFNFFYAYIHVYT